MDGGKIVATKQYTMIDSSLDYKVSPLMGDNRVVFKLTDRFSNKAEAEVLLTRLKTPEPVVNSEPVKPQIQVAQTDSAAGHVADTSVASPDISAVTSQSADGCGYMWMLWTALGLGLFFLFFILWRRKKKDKKE